MHGCELRRLADAGLQLNETASIAHRRFVHVCRPAWAVTTANLPRAHLCAADTLRHVMEGRLLLKDCSLFRADGRVRSGMAILIEGRTISKIAEDVELPVLPGDWEVKCRGRLVTPGLVDCHSKLVSGQLFPWSGSVLLGPAAARAKAELATEQKLTVAQVEALTAAGLAKALRAGVTTVFDHLHAPRDVEGALEAQARTANRLGCRLIASHASGSATPSSPGPAQVEANARFVAAHRHDELVRGLIGLTQSSQADDDVLRIAGRSKEELGVGAHILLAPDDDDLAVTWARYGMRTVNRFETFGLFGASSIAAHARAIDRAEAQKLASTRTVIALSPRTAQTLQGGAAMGMEAVLLLQNLVGLCTGGISSLWEELAASFTGVMALARTGRMVDPDNVMASFLMSGPAELCAMVFAVPCGTVDAGALADLVVYDTLPARETGNFTPHLLLQLSQERVAWTIVNGRVVVREGQLIGADFVELTHEARAVIESLA